MCQDELSFASPMQYEVVFQVQGLLKVMASPVWKITTKQTALS